MCLLCEQCVGSSTRVDALCFSCSLLQYLERQPAALYEAGQSVLMLMLMKGSKIPRIELNTIHLYQHYSPYMPNKRQYIWCGDYCKCVQPAQLPILTEAWTLSLLEQYPWHVPHWDRAGCYNSAFIFGVAIWLWKPQIIQGSHLLQVVLLLVFHHVCSS
jgi:hypothetical protein